MNDLEAANVLIIGGSGFVGRAIATHLIQNGCLVTLLNRGNVPVPNTRQLIADRNDIDKMYAAALEGERHYYAVIDTSALFGEQTRIAWDIFHKKTDHWIHLSSAAVYKNNTRPKENDEIGGADAWGDYGRNKSEADAFLLTQKEKPAITILRPPYIYGPDNNHDRETFIWSRVLRDRPVLIPGTGQTKIQFIHVQDLAAAVVCILKQAAVSAPRVYNIGDEEEITMQDYVSKLADISQSKDTGICVGEKGSGFNPRQYFPFRDYPCVVDVNKIRDELDWKPQFNFLTGFQQTFSYYGSDFLKDRLIETDVEDEILKKMFI